MALCRLLWNTFTSPHMYISFDLELIVPNYSAQLFTFDLSSYNLYCTLFSVVYVYFYGIVTDEIIINRSFPPYLQECYAYINFM